MAGLTRGDVHLTRFGRPTGRAQAGLRPAVVLQADSLAGWSTVVVAPLSRSAQATSFRPRVSVKDEETRVMTDHLRAIDPARIGKRLGRLTPDALSEVDTALKAVLGLR